MRYASLLAYMSAGTLSTLRAIEFQVDFNCNIIHKIWKALFLLPVCIIEIVFAIILFILSIVGKIIMIIPLIRFIYAAIFEIVHFIAFGFGIIGNLFEAGEYINHMSASHREDYNESLLKYN